VLASRDGLADKSKKDRVPYDLWAKQGHLLTAPGKSVDYEYVAQYLRGVFDRYNIRTVAFDRWNMRHLKPWLLKAGFTEQMFEANFKEFGQGTQSMSPALRVLEGEILNGRIAHGDHPVLKMCAANAVVEGKDSSNRKLSKDPVAGRIDGMVALAMAFGAAPLEEPDGRGNPVALIPVNPELVILYEANDGGIFYSVSRGGVFLTALLRDQPLMIPEEDVFHLRDIGFNMLMGLSRISIARDSFGVAMGLEQQAARFMNNGARPSGVLQTPKLLSVDAAERLKAQWEQMKSGIQNAGKTAILEEGLEWKPMQLSSVDLQFMAQREFAIGDIARWFDMPLYKLGVPGEMARIKFDDADQAYVNTTIMPDLDAWEQKFIQKFDLDKQGLVADFDERRLLRAAEATRINNQRLAIMSGIKTQNECRAENGYPAMEGGDVLLTPVNLAAVGSDMSGTAPDGAGRPNDGQLPDPGAANEDKAFDIREARMIDAMGTAIRSIQIP
jgi:HK97 family phage portal protein